MSSFANGLTLWRGISAEMAFDYDEICPPWPWWRHWKFPPPPPPPWWKDATISLSTIVNALTIQAFAGKESGSIGKNAQAFLDVWEGDWCGTPPRRHPIPGPKADVVLAVVNGLTNYSRSLPAGELKNRLDDFAGRLAGNLAAPRG